MNSSNTSSNSTANKGHIQATAVNSSRAAPVVCQASSTSLREARNLSNHVVNALSVSPTTSSRLSRRR